MGERTPGRISKRRRAPRHLFHLGTFRSLRRIFGHTESSFRRHEERVADECRWRLGRAEFFQRAQMGRVAAGASGKGDRSSQPGRIMGGHRAARRGGICVEALAV